MYSVSGSLLQEFALAGTPSVVRGGNTGGVRGNDIITGGSKSASIGGAALAGGFVQVLQSDVTGWTLSQTRVIDGQPVSLDVADLDGDGLDGIVTANASPTAGASGSELPVLTILRNVAGTFGQPLPVRPQGAAAARSVALVDVDLDGDRDILAIDEALAGARTTRLLRVDTAGEGTPLTIREIAQLPVTAALECVRANLDGGRGDDAYLSSAPSIGVTTATSFVAIPDPIPGDLDGDDAVSNADIGLLLLDFGPCPGCASDLDGNGEVDSGDIAFLLLLFG